MTGRFSSFLSVCLWAFLMSACNPERPPDYGVECDPEDNAAACSEGMECAWREETYGLYPPWRCSIPCSATAQCPVIECKQFVCGADSRCSTNEECEDDGYCRVCSEAD